MMQLAAIVVAGGSGDRFGGFKQLYDLGGKPVIMHSLETLKELSLFKQCVIVMAEQIMDDPAWKETISKFDFPGLKVVSGGKTRQDSVRIGLNALRDDTQFVAIHDAARPFFPVEAFQKSLQALQENSMLSGVIVASPCRDTIKRVSLPTRDEIAATIPRDEFVRAETPQTCRYPDLLRAYEVIRGKRVTDESMILEMSGMKTGVVLHDQLNLKITTRQDMLLATAWLNQKEKSKPST